MTGIPRWEYFVPFYGTYRTIRRMRRLENSVAEQEARFSQIQQYFHSRSLIADQVRLDLDQARRDIDTMKRHSFNEAQFYEARIETIYQRIMSLIDLDPKEANIRSFKFLRKDDE